MFGGRDMLETLDIGGPIDARGILRSGYRETQMRRATRRLDQQSLQRRLAVVTVGAEIA